MKKLLKAPVGVQLSVLFLLFMFGLFVATAPWYILAVFFGIGFTILAIFAVADYFLNSD